MHFHTITSFLDTIICHTSCALYTVVIDTVLFIFYLHLVFKVTCHGEHGSMQTATSQAICPTSHLFPLLFSHAKADAPPTGLANRGFGPAAEISLPFSPDTVRFT